MQLWTALFLTGRGRWSRAVTATTRTAHDNERRRRVRARQRLYRPGRSNTTPLDKAAEQRLDDHHGSSAPHRQYDVTMSRDRRRRQQQADGSTAVQKSQKLPPKFDPDSWLCPTCRCFNHAYTAKGIEYAQHTLLPIARLRGSTTSEWLPPLQKRICRTESSGRGATSTRQGCCECWSACCFSSWRRGGWQAAAAATAAEVSLRQPGARQATAQAATAAEAAAAATAAVDQIYQPYGR